MEIELIVCLICVFIGGFIGSVLGCIERKPKSDKSELNKRDVSEEITSLGKGNDPLLKLVSEGCISKKEDWPHLNILDIDIGNQTIDQIHLTGRCYIDGNKLIKKHDGQPVTVKEWRRFGNGKFNYGLNDRANTIDRLKNESLRNFEESNSKKDEE